MNIYYFYSLEVELVGSWTDRTSCSYLLPFHSAAIHLKPKDAQLLDYKLLVV